jgi:general secretion pathway protein B
LSFILDALRKSESDRQRLGTVALADLPIARQRRGQPWWVFALGGLLLVNLLVLMLLVLTRDKSATVSPTSATPATTVPSNTLGNTSIAPPAPRVAAAAAPTPTANNPLQAATAQVQYETVPASELEIANAAASMPDGQTLVHPNNALQNNTNKEAIGAGSVTPDPSSTQELHLDLHVYSKDARERFVLINMRRYTEGMRLPNGATVEQITPEGVVVYQNGSRYQIDRR